MASLHQRGNTYWVKFRFGGKQIYRTLKTAKEKEAVALQAQIERTLSDLERGRLTLPPDADLWAFVLSDGKLTAKPAAETPEPEKVVTLADLWAAYFASQVGNKEANTLATEQLHRRHTERVIGGRTAVRGVTGATVQNYINARSKERWAGKGIGPQTVRKEVATLRMLLNRAERLTGQRPATDTREIFRGLNYPKGKEKASFLTWNEIEAQIKRTKAGKKEEKELWDRLFLDKEQVGEFLDWVEAKPTRLPVPFLFPLLAAAAHTGARVSELIRSQVADWDFEAMVVTLREKKKSQKSETFRRVDLTARLADVLHRWLADHHPGGKLMFCRAANEPLNTQNLRTVFRKFVKKSKWDALKGYHVLRHSFASNLARKGIDERVIDELMGHQTEAMRKRYRHLFPDQRKAAVASVFG